MAPKPRAWRTTPSAGPVADGLAEDSRAAALLQRRRDPAFPKPSQTLGRRERRKTKAEKRQEGNGRCPVETEAAHRGEAHADQRRCGTKEAHTQSTERDLGERAERGTHGPRRASSARHVSRREQRVALAAPSPRCIVTRVYVVICVLGIYYAMICVLVGHIKF